MAKNHEDEYSYHFTIEYEDGQEWTESIDSRYKNKVDEDYARGRVHMMYQEETVSNITFDGVSRNY
jgi:hypothetical protein